MTQSEVLFEHDGCKFLCRENTNDFDVVRSVFAGEYALPNVHGYEPGAFCLDIGAHLGSFTAWCCKQYHDCRVVAVEPMPENQVLFARNMELNGLTNRVNLIRAAGWSTKEAIVSIPYGDDSTESGRTHFYVGNASAIPKSHLKYTIARTVSLHDIMAGIPKVWCAKFDAENAEYPLLKEAQADDLNRIRWVKGEFHSGIDDIRAIMIAQRFREHATDRSHELFCFENPKPFSEL